MLLSIVIPVYNCEKYISICLDSLGKQGFDINNSEIIIVDDASIDSTRLIAESYRKRYKNIKIITNKSNSGVSYSRNRGIEFSEGKYIAFLDADDFVTENLYLKIVDIMESNNLECFYFGSTTNKEKLEVFNSCFYYVNKENSVKSACWRYVYLKSIIVQNRLFFDPNIYYAEDFLFNYIFVINMEAKMAGSAQCVHFYNLNFNQATQKFKNNAVYTTKYINSIIAVCLKIKEYSNRLNLMNDVLYKKAISAQMMSLLWGGMICKVNPFKMLKTIKKKGLKLKDISCKVYEGSTRRLKLKSRIEYLFRFPLFYIFVCIFYKLIG